jgi:ribosomal protein L22
MTEENKEQKMEEKKIEETKIEEKVEDKKEIDKKEKSKETKKEIEKKPKKTEAIVNAKSIPISTLDGMYICKFIKKKTIEKAIADLEQVLKFKRAIPMRGEVAHRKGRIMSGKYPIKPVGYFIRLLKSLQANANANSIDEPVIVEAIANIAYRPYGRFGSIRRKRTHVKIKVIEKKLISKKKKSKEAKK